MSAISREYSKCMASTGGVRALIRFANKTPASEKLIYDVKIEIITLKTTEQERRHQIHQVVI
jgi:hypothetical protein